MIYNIVTQLRRIIFFYDVESNAFVPCRDALQAESADEIERLRIALRTIRGHTARPLVPSEQLLNGLLDSIQRIADKALEQKVIEEKPGTKLDDLSWP